MLHSPMIPHVSTARRAAWRSIWYSSSVRVWDGAMTMLSPVWTRMLRTFSMLQTVSELPIRSRTTSYSICLNVPDVALEEDLADRARAQAPPGDLDELARGSGRPRRPSRRG